VLSVENYGSAIRDCTEALRIDAENVKALFRAAKASFKLGKIDACLELGYKVLKLDGKNKDALELMRLAEAAKKEISIQAEKAKRQNIWLSSLEKSLVVGFILILHDNPFKTPTPL
jgi:tetratricopeptide (TPR) repeat protein